MSTARQTRPSCCTSGDAGLPYTKSVLRQTQGVIGAAVLAGVWAAWRIDIAWAAVPAVVGVGLLMAGLTGVCPMALIIARLPWNAERRAEAVPAVR